MRILIAVACALMAGCASAGAVVVPAVCTACGIIQGIGLCAGTERALQPEARIVCPSSQKLYIVNFDKVSKEGEAPRFECRK